MHWGVLSSSMPLETMRALASVPPRPWSAKKLRRLGECLRDDHDVPPDHPPYEDVMVWYDDLAAAVNADIRSLDWGSLLVGRQPPEITSRAKTIDTLRDKLRRDRGTPLSSIQDVAGVRFECEMTLEEQDIVAAAVASAFDCTPDSIHDLRDGRHSGYRAVHVWLRLPQGRVEVQVRTHIQGEWANTYETLADWLGRGIRYGQVPESRTIADLVESIQSLSLEEGALLEQRRQRLSELVRNSGRLASETESRLTRTTPASWHLRSLIEHNGRATRELNDEALQREQQYTQRLQDLERMFVEARNREGKTWPAL